MLRQHRISMPVTKKRPYRPRAKKGIHPRKRAPTTITLAKRIKRVEKDIELKWIDELNTNSGVPITSSGYAVTLNNIAEGLTVNTRVGQKIRMTSCQLKYVAITQTTVLYPILVRIMLVIDKARNGNSLTFDGTPLGVDGLLDNSTITSVGCMPRAFETRYRYHVLYDKFHVLVPPAANVANTTTLQKEVQVTRNIRLNHIVNYGDATSFGASLLKNSLNLFVISDQTSGSSAGPLVAVGTRIYFKDA